MIIAGVIYRYCNRLVFEKIWPYVAGYLLFGFVVVLTLISVTVDYYAGYGPVLSKLNRITTGRINLAYQGACISNWRLFTSGADLSVTVDNGFAAIPANYGIVVGIIYILFVGFVMYKCTKQKNGITFAIVVTCILYTFMERSYTINDAYLLSNLTVVVAMMLKGIEGKNSETVL